MKLKIQGLSCGYNDQALIEDLSFELGPGELFLVLGANGIGKTTLFRTIMGYLKPLAGRVCIGDQDLAQLSPKEKAKLLSYVPQAGDLAFDYQVEDVLLMARTTYLQAFSSYSQEDYDLVDQAMALMEIEHLKGQVYSRLSSGQKQLVLIARSLVQNANFILMDEPSSNLDYGNQKRLLRAIKRLQDKGYGIVMISHDPNYGLYFQSTTCFIFSAQDHEIGPSQEMINEERLAKAYGTSMDVIEYEKNGRKEKRVLMGGLE